MKKKQLKKLKLNKNTISKIGAEKIQGGVSGHCNSSIPDLQCYFPCATAEGVCASLEC
ncbi:hypothetical protein [Aquimarina algiphila]|uniref:hypothetical protein n=1 Tax=Aquimarina algiphila TaxID=2047982 RepID=UPI00232AA91A|nr:hypothetical protein [Aquimarina algiphila]